MKKYIDKYENIYIVGNTNDIKAIYHSMVKAKETNLTALYSEHPYYSEDKETYAICVETISKWFYIINSDTMLNLIISGIVKEYKGVI